MSRYKKSSNPFEDDDNDYSSPYGNNESPFEDRREQLMRSVHQSENNQLESTRRAMAAISESEAMGVATAEELMRQKETLDNIEAKTDGMQQNLTTSQKHLNNIKSVFGGIKNWWSKDKNVKAPEQNENNTSLRNTVRDMETQRDRSSHSKPDVRGFYDDDDGDLDSRFMSGARSPAGSASGGYKVISPVTRSAREAEIDDNLTDLSLGMERLKGLASGLGDEIERQTEQLDRINNKVDKTDTLIIKQNSQMRKILRN